MLKKIGVWLVATFAMFGVQAFAVLPSYVTAALTDAQTQLTELIAAMVAAAVVLVLLALTPRVLLKMIRSLGGKVNF